MVKLYKKYKHNKKISKKQLTIIISEIIIKKYVNIIKISIKSY